MASAKLCRVLFVAVLLGLVAVDGFDSGLKLPGSRRREGTIGSRRARRRQLRNLTLSVAEFGAVGDGLSNDTQAFVEAWESACSERARVTIEIPANYVCLIGPVELGGSKCKSKLRVLVLGRILAPADPGVWDGNDRHKWLYFYGIKYFELAGGGTIDGMGQEWWARSCKINTTNPCSHAPTAVTFHRIKHLSVHDLNLTNSQQMHMAFTKCSQVKVSHVGVFAPDWSPNTDAIHISSCTSVTVEESELGTGDDCISIVGNSSNILVRNITCGPGHGISIGSLGKKGSSAKLENILVDGALISNTENGARIKTWQGGHGYARHITFQNLVMDNVSNPIIIDQYYCDSKTPCKNQTSAVHVYDVAFVSIRGTSVTECAVKFACSDTFPCEGLYLEDIELYLESGEVPSALCWKASGHSSGVFHPPSCLSDTDGVIEQHIDTNTQLVSKFR